MRRTSFLIAAALVVSSLSPAAAVAAAEDDYRPPTDRPVLDGFRPPPHPYGPGNRGIEYATSPGDPITAIGAGKVIFAGEVAGALHVTVLHPDGLRSSYSFLLRIAVTTGQPVRAGDLLGAADRGFHLGVRAGDEYIDPESIFGGAGHARLVPLPEPVTPARGEVASLLAFARGEMRGLGVGVADWWRGLFAVGAPLVHQLGELVPAVHLNRLGNELWDWLGDRETCTSEDQPATPPEQRRIAVLVAGIGSSSESAAVDDIDTAQLGYEPGDVVRFSYRGGVVPDGSDGIALSSVNSYGPADTHGDLRESARRLAELVREIASTVPGVPIDLLAHSQGGVVSRLAIEERGVVQAMGGGVLVTIGAPLQGADLATIAVALRSSRRGRSLLALVERAGLSIDPASPAVSQLAETSDVVSRLGDPPPEGVRMLTIGASGDLVVAGPRTQVDGSDGVIVASRGPAAHGELPAHPEVVREVSLLLAGRAPSCEPLVERITEWATGESVGLFEDTLGLGLAVAMGV
ncbi:MAG: hypothetical protein JJLCMIEE_02254 [Acidimicrobiales bacterium]|nr:MAG: hypothetical protein EDR02_08485 [Actinomycetota bacterium]MBV6509186.1 hypothetical protein [Acidimicrobiales bacterium]RIK08469.1 MAG: hypothetical protein DCC48_00520 [Acidobacteriota bacterium]